jgi:uncharacterized protein YbbK (DUF523 family)
MKMCPCGKPLHYNGMHHVQAMIEQQIEELGESVRVTVPEMGRSFMVPRHFVALHGIRAKDLPWLVGRYGIEEIE